MYSQHTDEILSDLGYGPDGYSTLLRSLLMDDDADTARQNSDLFAMVAGQQQALIGQAQTDLNRLLTVRGMQAYCLECPISPNVAAAKAPPTGWFAKAAAFFAD